MTVHEIAALVKSAAETTKVPALDYAEAVRQAHNDAMRADANTDIRNVALAAIGTGAVLRGGQELIRRLRRKRYQANPGVAMPIPEKIGSFLLGHEAKTKPGLPYYLPAIALAGAGGLYGGWKVTDIITDKINRMRRKRRVEDAQADFNDAMLAQYDNTKKASDSVMVKIGRTLDELHHFTDKLIKRGFDWRNNTGVALGAYGTYAGLSALLAGALAAKTTASNSDASAFNEAVNIRKKRRYAAAPSPIELYPEEINREMKLTKDEAKALTGAV